MGILTNIVAADEEEIVAVAHSLRPIDEWSGLEKRGIDAGKIVVLHCLLTGDDFETSVSQYEPVYISSEGVVILRIADALFEKLATLDEEALGCVAYELGATEEYEKENWDPADVHDMVMELADLARIADSQTQLLLVWMHPLVT